jgi:hypothetical protein
MNRRMKIGGASRKRLLYSEPRPQFEIVPIKSGGAVEPSHQYPRLSLQFS